MNEVKNLNTLWRYSYITIYITIEQYYKTPKRALGAKWDIEQAVASGA